MGGLGHVVGCCELDGIVVPAGPDEENGDEVDLRIFAGKIGTKIGVDDDTRCSERSDTCAQTENC